MPSAGKRKQSVVTRSQSKLFKRSEDAMADDSEGSESDTSPAATSTCKDTGSAANFAMLNRPNAKWRQLGIEINLEPQLDYTSTQNVRRIITEVFTKCYNEAVVLEQERVHKQIKQNQRTGRKHRPMARPTDVALNIMKEKGQVCNQGVSFGHVPGVAIGDVFKYKVQIKAVGLHRHVLAGIDYSTVGQSVKASLASSIAISGWYADDDDNTTEVLYTGQGGNDLMGRRVQVADQKLKRGNLALYNNALYGVPVRVIKKNNDKFIYDGLWDVLQMIKRKGQEGFVVYQYKLRRCPGQVPSFARQVKFKEGCSIKSTCPSTTRCAGEVVCQDFGRGITTQPITVTNEVDDELPPGLTLDDISEDARQLKEWKTSPDSFEFGTNMRYDINVPSLETKPVIPKKYQIDPHEYLTALNHGIVPYHQNGTLHHAMCLLYECGPWLQCPYGHQCCMAVTEKEPKWRFQLFKTRTRGWGVRTLDTIPIGSFVMKYIGEVFRNQDTGWDGNDMYSFDMVERPDYTPENIWIPGKREVSVDYVVTGRHYGNLFRFINHSCDPNCFTQPILSTHLDRTRPDIAAFSMRTILPGEEISYDYGRDYIETLLENNCECEMACCIGRGVKAVEV